MESGAACHSPRRRWMVWMPLLTMGLLFVAVLAHPGILKSPWGVALVGITAAGCPVMCLGAMALQALAMKPGSQK